MKPQLFILGNLNGKTYYFTFGVLFSDLSFFPLLKPKFFFLNFILKHFLKLRFFQNSRFFLKSDFFNTQGFFLKKLRCFQNSGCFFSKLRFFFKLGFFLKTKLLIVLNNAHVIYLLTTIVGSKKMNKMALMIKMVVICFMLHVPLDSNY